MKTVIKGLKEVKRLVGIKYDKEMPKLNYKTYLLESDETLQEFDEKLIRDGISVQETWALCISGTYSIGEYINVLYKGELEEIRIVKTISKDEIETIIVNKIIEHKEQEFNKNEIIKKYEKEFEEYYNKFMEQYKDDKIQMIEINTWLEKGLSREEVIETLQTRKKVEKDKDKQCFQIGGIISAEVFNNSIQYTVKC